MPSYKRRPHRGWSERKVPRNPFHIKTTNFIPSFIAPFTDAANQEHFFHTHPSTNGIRLAHNQSSKKTNSRGKTVPKVSTAEQCRENNKSLRCHQRCLYRNRLCRSRVPRVHNFVVSRLGGRKLPFVMVKLSSSDASKYIQYEKLLRSIHTETKKSSEYRHPNIGQIVAMIGETCPNYATILLASLRGGACVQPIEYHVGNLDCEAAVNITEPTVIVITRSILESKSSFTEIQNIASVRCILAYTPDIQNDRIGNRVILDLLYFNASGEGSNGEESSVEDLLEGDEIFSTRGNADPDEIGVDESDEDKTHESEIALVMNTYDAEGLMKGVLLTHKNVVCALRSITDSCYSPVISFNDTVVNHCPVSQIFGLILVLAAICQSARLKTISINMSIESTMKAVESSKASTLFTTSQTLCLLLQQFSDIRQRLKSLRRIVTYNSMPSRITCDIYRQKMPGVALRHLYGMAQTCGTVFTQIAKTVGTGWVTETLPGVEVEISKDQEFLYRKKPQMASDRFTDLGVIRVRGAIVMSGYLGDNLGTQKALDQNGWFTTSDIAYRGPNGEIILVDTLKNVFWSRGFEVSPLELENVIKTHPAVSDVFVLGVSDLPPSIFGEVPRAYIVLKQVATASEIKDYVKQRVASHKFLTGGVYFAHHIPRQGTGWEMRHKLRKVLLTPSKILVSTCSAKAEDKYTIFPELSDSPPKQPVTFSRFVNSPEISSVGKPQHLQLGPPTIKVDDKDIDRTVYGSVNPERCFPFKGKDKGKTNVLNINTLNITPKNSAAVCTQTISESFSEEDDHSLKLPNPTIVSTQTSDHILVDYFKTRWSLETADEFRFQDIISLVKHSMQQTEDQSKDTDNVASKSTTSGDLPDGSKRSESMYRTEAKILKITKSKNSNLRRKWRNSKQQRLVNELDTCFYSDPDDTSTCYDVETEVERVVKPEKSSENEQHFEKFGVFIR